MGISIRDALEAIAIISAMIAVIVVPHPANASLEAKEIKQLSNTNSLNCRVHYFPMRDISHGFLHPRLSGAAADRFSRITWIRKEVR